jgi:hypothetical protein
MLDEKKYKRNRSHIVYRKRYLKKIMIKQINLSYSFPSINLKNINIIMILK